MRHHAHNCAGGDGRAKAGKTAELIGSS